MVVALLAQMAPMVNTCAGCAEHEWSLACVKLCAHKQHPANLVHRIHGAYGAVLHVLLRFDASRHIDELTAELTDAVRHLPSIHLSM